VQVPLQIYGCIQLNSVPFSSLRRVVPRLVVININSLCVVNCTVHCGSCCGLHCSSHWSIAIPAIHPESRFVPTPPAFHAQIEGAEKLEWCGYLTVKIFWRYVYSFRQTPRTWCTDGRTDGPSDTAWLRRPCLHSSAWQKYNYYMQWKQEDCYKYKYIVTYPSNVCEKYFSVFAISAPDAAGNRPFTVREW